MPQVLVSRISMCTRHEMTQVPIPDRLDICLQVPLKNYDTVPATVVQPLVYLPANQLSTGQGQGRQFTFPQINSTAYVDALEKMYFSVAQVALGNLFCTPG